MFPDESPRLRRRRSSTHSADLKMNLHHPFVRAGLHLALLSANGNSDTSGESGGFHRSCDDVFTLKVPGNANDAPAAVSES